MFWNNWLHIFTCFIRIYHISICWATNAIGKVVKTKKKKGKNNFNISYEVLKIIMRQHLIVGIQQLIFMRNVPIKIRKAKMPNDEQQNYEHKIWQWNYRKQLVWITMDSGICLVCSYNFVFLVRVPLFFDSVCLLGLNAKFHNVFFLSV